MVSAVESGSSTGPRISTPSTGQVVTPRTRTTYRMLLLRGLAPDEASNLTAYLCGIPVGTQHWQIREINKLLFLRELNDSGRFGPDDGATAGE
jgi:hypothetical protein